MRAEDVEEKKPSLIELGKGGEGDYLLPNNIIKIIVLVLSLGVSLVLGKVDMTGGIGENLFQYISVVTLMTVFLYLISLISAGLVWVITSLIIYSVQEGKYIEWEDTDVRDYLGGLGTEKVEGLNKIEVNRVNEADVMFVYKGELREEKAEVSIKEITDPYVTFVENDYTFAEDIKKGELYNVVVYLPEDYKIE